jgi:hypothetical protein
LKKQSFVSAVQSIFRKEMPIAPSALSITPDQEEIEKLKRQTLGLKQQMDGLAEALIRLQQEVNQLKRGLGTHIHRPQDQQVP